MRTQLGKPFEFAGFVWRTTLSNRLLNPLIRKLPAAARPWTERNRLRLAVESGERLVPERELQEMFERALSSLVERDGAESVGDYFEFGVYTGTSMLCMHRATQALGLERMRLFGFDSFNGLPPAADDEPGPWAAGQMKSDRAYVLSRLKEHGVQMRRVLLVKGWFEETLDQKLIRDRGMTKASVIMIDSDLYSSAKTALTFVAP